MKWTNRIIRAAVLTAVTLAGAGAMLAYRLGAEEKPAGQTALSLAEFDKLHKELQPPKDELWRSIPWQVSILEARDLAAKEKKPIFVWVASGEPLGCG